MIGIKLFGGKVGYRFLPKVACTSIKEELYRLERDRTFNKNDYDGKHIHQYMNRHHNDIDDCSFRFIVVRDPIKRFLSGYSNRVLYHKELSVDYIKERHPELLDSIPVFDPSLDDFIKYLNIYRKVDSINHHIRPIVDFLEGNSLDYFSNVYPMEKINDLRNDLERITGTKVSFGRSQTGGKKFTSDDLAQEQIDFLLNFYKADYQLLNKYYPSTFYRNEKMIDIEHESAAPFIIWTFRRTGGTNLGQSLFVSSQFKAVEHEPFNGDRVFGHVVKEWKENHDFGKLYTAIEGILQEKPLIKHCLEILPQELNTALAEVSQKLGYRHLFLYREMPKDRLLSLNYAQKTGVWGKGQREKIKLDDSIFDRHIETERLLFHEKECRKKMKQTYDYLLSMDAKPLYVSFENLYQSASIEYSVELAKSIFSHLIGNCSDLSDSFFRGILKRGGQGTKSDYLKFKDSQVFVAEISKFSEFYLEPTLKVQWELQGKKEDIEHFELWADFPGVQREEFFLSGGVLFKNKVNSLVVENECKEGMITWRLPSKRIGEMFPKNAQAQNCRFIAGPFTAGAEVELNAQDSSGTILPICKVYS